MTAKINSKIYETQKSSVHPDLNHSCPHHNISYPFLYNKGNFQRTIALESLTKALYDMPTFRISMEFDALHTIAVFLNVHIQTII